MAKFQIKLLTSRLGDQNSFSTYLETPISEFHDQLLNQHEFKSLHRTHTYCYTFNEKVSFHTNGQKTLSFSMMKNIWLDNEMTTNPFVSKLKNGTQLLLIDQYDNEYFFTVSDIQYTIKQSNIVYAYTCQDSFTHQHIRQQNGYTINNDPQSSDFIGAKNVDWWVVNKISPECHISYEYIPLSGGLYVSRTTGNLCLYTTDDQLKDVKKIIKPVFTKEDYPELYEEFPFSVSGGNASSALISLADEIGLMLNFKEQNIVTDGKRGTYFVRYFWLEPKKNERNANLKYSPNTDIQSFSFSHKGSSLTTILNVDNNTINDEIVSLLPATTPFFNSLFSSNIWKKSTYSNGFFNRVCQEESMFCESGNGYVDQFRYNLEIKQINELTSVDQLDNNSFFEATEHALYLKLTNGESGFTIPSFYDKVTFFNDQVDSEFIINSQIYNARTSIWELAIIEQTTDKDANGVRKKDPVIYRFNDSYSTLDSSRLGLTYNNCYLRIATPGVIETPTIGESKVLIKFYRDATEEDLQFAKIADECPWLENKLIDFSYFLNQKILSKAEYMSLMNSLLNDLRIINGELLYYSNQYYQAIRDKTKEVSDLINMLDSLGAAFASDAVNTYKTSGSIKNVDYFTKAYSTLQITYANEAKPSTILDYDGLVTEYFNKYFNAQQRFLKNIYNFKKIFNEKYSWKGNDAAIYKARLELTPMPDVYENSVQRYYSFNSRPIFKQIDENFKSLNESNLKPLHHVYLKDLTTKATVVDQTNYTQFFTCMFDEATSSRCGDEDGYVASQLYYKVAYKVEKHRASLFSEKQIWPTEFTDKTSGRVFYKYKTDETYIWYGSALPVSLIEDWPSEIKYTDPENEERVFATLTKDFILLTFSDIVNEYVYRRLYDQKDLSWFYHDTDTDEETQVWWDPDDIDDNLNGFLPTVFGNSFLDKEWTSDSYSQLAHRILSSITNTDNNETTDERANFYKAHFPVTTVKYIGQGFTQRPYKIGDIEMPYQPIGKSGQSLIEYIDYLKNKYVYNKEGLVTVNNPLTEQCVYSIPLVNSSNEQEFYRRIPKGGGIANTSCEVDVNLLSQMNLTASEVKEWDVNALVKRNAIHSLWYDNTTWGLSGINSTDFYGATFDTQKGYIGFHDTDAIYYAKTSESYNEWKAIDDKRHGIGFEIDSIKLTEERDSNSYLWDTYLENGKTYYLQYTKHHDYNEYFNLYSKIGLTYSKARNMKLTRGRKLLFKNGFLRPVKLGEEINTSYQYRVLTLQNEVNEQLFNTIFQDDYSIENYLDENGRLSKVIYYFLYNNTSPLNVKNCTDTWGNYFSLATEDSEYVFVPSNEKNGKQCIIFQEEDFKYVRVYDSLQWSGGVIKQPYRLSVYKSNEDIHDSSNQSIINFSKIPDLTKGLYRSTEKNSWFTQITENSEVVWSDFETLRKELEEGSEPTSTTQFFKKDDKDGFVRAYSLIQMAQLGGYFYIDNDIYEEEVINSSFEFNPSIYLHQKTYTDGKIDTNPNNTFSIERKEKFTFDPVVDWSDDHDAYVKTFTFTDEKGIKYSRECKFTLTKVEDITNTTKGDFWYRYHSRVDNAILFEEAAAIETQLTQCWQEAYSASLYCEYFLPPSWQSRSGGEMNYFADGVIATPAKAGLPATLSNKYLPDVKIYSNGNITKFPKWQLEYRTELDTDRYTIDDTKEQINNYADSLASVVLSHVTPFVHAFDTLKDNMSNFIVSNNDSSVLDYTKKQTYYYNANQMCGVKWNNFLQKHSTLTDTFENYSGLHVMAYSILRSHFKSKPMSLYEQSQEKQLQLWNTLYKKYPGVLLEDSYSNSDVTTSEELYILAKNTFMDKQEPERSYSISLINMYKDLSVKQVGSNIVTQYQPYNNHELKIGDGILIDVDEYYDTYDDIYKTLSQYLFITDISYDLRRDDNVQLTVNNIKYQDKLIQRLVKLIK